MNVFGFEIRRRRKGLTAVDETAGGWRTILETFPGAWQWNATPATAESALAYSAVYSCVSLIAGDVAKLRLRLMQQAGATWEEVTDGANAFLPVIRKPNAYQTRVQFFTHWVMAKLMFGNAYILKERDDRRVVRALYPLHSPDVTPLVADSGEVFYRLRRDTLAGVADSDIVVPASEIIHDRMMTFLHPLVGVSPIYACGTSALQGRKIQANSEKFFANMSRPSGVLTAPGRIADETAARLKAYFDENFSGDKIGRVAVAGDGLKYEAMTIPAADAQLIEQLGWTVGDVARCYHVPAYKIGLQASMTLGNSAQYDQDYYSQCLQLHIEGIEVLMDEALDLRRERRTEFDLDDLLRMDPLGQAEANAKQIGAGALAPNEARRRMNLPAVKGGDSPYLQQQNYSLEALARRDAQDDPFGRTPPPAPPPAPAPDEDDVARALAQRLLPVLEQKLAPAPREVDEAEALVAAVEKRLAELGEVA
jgi:HK97 family phage portal protein